MKQIAIFLILFYSCNSFGFGEIIEIELGNNRRGPVQVIDLNDIMNNLNRRRGVMREITIEVSPEGITETTKTIDNEGNETIEITQQGNLNKGNKRTNAGEIIFGIDNSIENLIFGLLNGRMEIGGRNHIIDKEDIEEVEETEKEHEYEKHRFDNITTADLEFESDSTIKREIIDDDETNKNKPNNDKRKSKKKKDKKLKDKLNKSNHKSLGEDLITQINHAHIKVEELKKEKPKISFLAKVIKFVFYFLALIIMIFIMRVTLKHISLAGDYSKSSQNLSDTVNKDHIENIITENADNKEKIEKAD